MEIRRAESITYAEIDAYARVTGVRFTPLVVSALMAMNRGADRAFDEVLKATTEEK